jgi:hypothetical protein
MKAVKAIYEKGKIKLSEKPVESGPLEVLVVFPEEAADPWQEILSDAKPRPKLNKLVEQVKKQVGQGKAKPLNLDDL